MQSQISVNWQDAKQTVVLVTFPKLWSWQDLYTCIDDINKLLDSVTHSVYTIFDFTLSTKIPDNALGHIKRLNMTARPNQDKIAIVGLETFGRVLIDMFIRLYGTFSKGTDIKMVSDIPSAYQYFDIEMITSDEM